MDRFLQILNFGFPVGRVWNTSVRLHFSFILYVIFQTFHYGSIAYGLLFFGGYYFCILLHEFGHVFAARATGGQADEILIWPLGGLAYCNPPFNAMANLVTAAGGPLVTLCLWGFFSFASAWIGTVVSPVSEFGIWIGWFFRAMRDANFWLLLFNLIPALPLDGGRMFRDVLWHWTGPYKATYIAVIVSKVIVCIVGAWALMTGSAWLIFIMLFIWFEADRELQMMNAQDGFDPGFSFSWLDRWREARQEKKIAKRTRMQMLESKDHFISEQVDPILDKIARQGMQSLTEEEKRILERAKDKLR